MHINRVVMTGNCTRDPELRSLPSGTSMCKLGVACNGRRKDQSGEWVDKPGFFDVTVWGKSGENCAKFLSKGSPVAIDGRLEWSSWEDKETGGKRSKVEIVADTVQFLGSKDDSPREQSSDVPSDFPSAPANAPDDADMEIPF